MVYLSQGERAKAEEEFLRALEILVDYGARVECLMVATELLRLARHRDDESAARERLAALYAVFEGGHEYRPLRAAKALLDETAG